MGIGTKYKGVLMEQISGLMDAGCQYTSSSVYHSQIDLFNLLERMYGPKIEKSKIIGTRPERPSSVPRKEYVKYRLKKIPDYLNKNLNIGITDKWAQVNLKGSFATSLNFYLDILDYFGL